MPFRFSDEWHEQKSRAERMAKLKELAHQKRNRREGMILIGVIVLLTIITYYL